MTSFKDLGLSDNILKAITELGFEKPSDIQTEAIPQLLEEDSDLIGLAQTGTGKTAAFGLPLVEKVDVDDDCIQALVLAPTRELVQQILEQLKRFSKYKKGLNVLAVYGGASIRDQMKDLKKTRHIIAATPGRLIDLIKRKKINLENIKYVVLDEADEMLNMGFKEEIDEILSFTPEDKYTWLFSATMAAQIKKIVSKYMDNPKEIKINSKNIVNKNISHQYITVRRSDKSKALMRILDMNGNMRSVVFCKTRRDTQELAEELLGAGYKADAIHGDLSQAQRDRVMGRFKDHQLELLIATDVAARGIDVDDLTHVIHFALPDDKAYYTHRSGRTARAGKKGISLVFINGREKYKIKHLETLLKIEFQKIEIPSSSDVAINRMVNWANSVNDLDLGKGVDDNIFKEVTKIFEDSTKEALLAKLVLTELNKLSLGNDRELNEEESAGGGGGGRGRGGDRRRGSRGGQFSRRGGRGGRGRGSDRRRSGRSRDGERSERRDGDERGGRRTSRRSESQSGERRSSEKSKNSRTTSKGSRRSKSDSSGSSSKGNFRKSRKKK